MKITKPHLFGLLHRINKSVGVEIAMESTLSILDNVTVSVAWRETGPCGGSWRQAIYKTKNCYQGRFTSLEIMNM